MESSENNQKQKTYREYMLALNIYIKNVQEPQFVKSLIKELSLNNLARTYEKKTGTTGLQNLGQTCYLNSIIQCLRHCMVMNQYLFGSKIQSVIEKNLELKNTSPQQIALTINYIKIVNSLWENEKSAISPVGFKTLFGQLHQQFQGNDQQDAHEFAVTLLDSFHETLSRNVVYLMTGNVINKLDVKIKKAHDAWALFYKKRHSIILDIFSGQLQVENLCPDCHQITHVFDPVMAFAVNFPPTICEMSVSSCTLYDCFDHFVKPEQLTEENARNCDTCKKKTQAIRTMSVWTLPNLMIITIKRFQHRLDPIRGYITHKIRNFVHYPVTDLNLSKYVSSPHNDQTKYDLFAVVCHRGQTLQQGHYYSYCLNQLNNQWHFYNDGICSSVKDMGEIVSEDAYMLFYQKQRTST